MRNCWILVLIILVSVFACQRNPLKIDVSDIEITQEFKSYDEALLETTEQLEMTVPKLEQEYGRFFELFNYHMIGIGGPEQADFLPQLKSFVADTMIVNLKQQTDKLIDREELADEFQQAFKHYHYYFPEKVVPNIYTCISGLNQSVVVADSLIGISLDKYLGADSYYYPRLGIPAYKIRNMYPQKIVPDAMYFWGATEFPISAKASKVVESMVHQGSLLYFVEAMMPEAPDSVVVGYTGAQLTFCENSEAAMWSYMAEQNLLFSTNRMDIKRYVDDGPYTSSFSTESPGRVGAWLGWQIVRSYMRKNPETTLQQLMENHDYLGILNQSGYQPE
ncbi:hypothetical protein [Sunxiuqinia elliptica]|uniref:Gliding motility-associated lipoprotein GldB n=1 Tax=Sunxiuqinia elliptica TaxID=655355 RepID=A0A4V3BYG8_9BACT|nr:hypothetical protein [Sunxiuqinia elliptica]TDO02609.1 hypothetical protein DET52_10474 [Sunxiuqinia elliptica]TDO58653.1 hypothetical protein DET65_3178 [Sunxiuqinia elliptica]